MFGLRSGWHDSASQRVCFRWCAWIFCRTSTLWMVPFVAALNWSFPETWNRRSLDRLLNNHGSKLKDTDTYSFPHWNPSFPVCSFFRFKTFEIWECHTQLFVWGWSCNSLSKAYSPFGFLGCCSGAPWVCVGQSTGARIDSGSKKSMKQWHFSSCS